MADKTNANIGFEKQLWDAACVLWGHIPAAEYRKVIVGSYFSSLYFKQHLIRDCEELIEEGDGFEDDRDAYADGKCISLCQRKLDGATLHLNAHTPEIGSSYRRCDARH